VLCCKFETVAVLCCMFQTFSAPSFDDKILEVVAVFGSTQLAVSRVIDLQHHRIAQVTNTPILHRSQTHQYCTGHKHTNTAQVTNTPILHRSQTHQYCPLPAHASQCRAFIIDLLTARPKWRLDGPALSIDLYSLVNHAYANHYHHYLVRSLVSYNGAIWLSNYNKYSGKQCVNYEDQGRKAAVDRSIKQEACKSPG